MIYGLLPQLYEARGFNQISLSPEIQRKARENPLKKKIAPLNPADDKSYQGQNLGSIPLGPAFIFGRDEFSKEVLSSSAFNFVFHSCVIARFSILNMYCFFYKTDSSKYIINHNKLNLFKACLHAQSGPTLCDPMNCSLEVSFVRGVSQGRILGWVAISFSRGSSCLRDQTHISSIGRHILYHGATWAAHI